MGTLAAPELEALVALRDLPDRELEFAIIDLTQVLATRRATADIQANPVQHEPEAVA